MCSGMRVSVYQCLEWGHNESTLREFLYREVPQLHPAADSRIDLDRAGRRGVSEIGREGRKEGKIGRASCRERV